MPIASGMKYLACCPSFTAWSKLEANYGCVALKVLDNGRVPAGPTTQTFVAYCEELSVKLKTGGMVEAQVSSAHETTNP